MISPRTALSLALLLLPLTATAADHLPPVRPWSGPSENLALDPTHEWATPCEQSGLESSPDYDTTVQWLWRLVEAADELEMVSLGRSPQQREIWAVIASTEGAFTEEALRDSERPLILAHSGIHSGEIDGKDAGMMLLRDLTVTERYEGLLDGVNVVFVPIFSVDAHEMGSETSRMNQRGPTVQGWRTNARNLNLNRDYVKGESVEMQHMLRALRAYDPDLYVDLHVTDGADYQYDVTYGFNGEHGWSPHAARWLGEVFRPRVDRKLSEMGHLPGPLIFTVDRRDVSKGIHAWTASPRYSHGYGDARHIPSILVENHSLKPYPQRVLGTYVFLRAALATLADFGQGLREAKQADRASRPDPVHLGYRVPEGEPATMEFGAIGAELELSPISGRPEVRWTGRPYVVEVPVIASTERALEVPRPTAYVIPAAWSHLSRILDLHGIEYEVLSEWRRIRVERDRLPDAEIADEAYEGRVRVTPGDAEAEVDRVDFAPGSLWVDTDQPAGTLACLLLEPQSSDSLLQWGYFLEILQRTEYFESYVMEPMAREMLETDPELAARFEQRLLEDPAFRGDPRARLDFFYRRTPYYDPRWKLHPVGRVFE